MRNSLDGRDLLKEMESVEDALKGGEELNNTMEAWPE